MDSVCPTHARRDRLIARKKKLYLWTVNISELLNLQARILFCFYQGIGLTGLNSGQTCVVLDECKIWIGF